MMELLLLRHAQALAATAGQADAERALSEHGRLQARSVGAWLAGQSLRPDKVLCSPARRTRETAGQVLEAMGHPVPVVLEARIYEATPGELLAVLEALPVAARVVLLVGHNPGVSQALALLCAHRVQPWMGMSPACLAHVRVARPVEPGQGHLLDLHRAEPDSARRS